MKRNPPAGGKDVLERPQKKKKKKWVEKRGGGLAWNKKGGTNETGQVSDRDRRKSSSASRDVPRKKKTVMEEK